MVTIIELKQGKNGYGFVLSNEDCGRVTNIKAKSPAARAKMKTGQDIIALKDVNEEGHEELIYVADLEVEELKEMIESHVGTLTLHVSEVQLNKLEGPWWRNTGPAPTVHPLWFQSDQSTTSGVKRQTKPPPPPPSKRNNVDLIKVSFFIFS